MKTLEFKELNIPEVQVLVFARFCDDRGYFTETYRKSDFAKLPQASFPTEFVQANESWSHAGTFRGMHFQWNPYMGKLVRCVTGEIVDFALDIRKNSPTFGHVVAYPLSAKSNRDYSEWIWVPPGFAHGIFAVDKSLIEYLCTGEYSQGCEACITICDTDIDFSLCDISQRKLENSIKHISAKDKEGLTLAQWLEKPESEEFVYGK